MHASILLVSETPESEAVEPGAEVDVEVEAVEPEEAQGKQLSILKYLLLQSIIILIMSMGCIGVYNVIT